MNFNRSSVLIFLSALVTLLILIACILFEHDSQDVQVITVDYANVIGSGPKYFGIEYSWIDQDKDLFLDRYRKLHGNLVRVQISQELFEPTNDNNDPYHSEIDFSLSIPIDSQMGKTMTFESMFKSLAAEFPGMHFQINIWLCARWNAIKPDGYLGIGGAFPPKDYSEHREFIRALARWLIDDCGIQPKHLSFTFINEANLKSFFVGTQDDLVRMAEETRAALDQVSPLIKMGGLDEVHGTSWTDEFYHQCPASCCDLWTFHVYERGLPSMWKVLQKRTEHLSQYGPVWVTEFADITNGSPDAKMDFSTRKAALGFAELLGRLWPTQIDGIVHFRLSDTYTDLFDFGGWVGHGLFANARGTHSDGQAYEPFPAYWVFANMYRELGGGQIVSTTTHSDLTVVSTRKDSETEACLAVWVTNSTTESYATALRVNNFPTKGARVRVFDNLVDDKPVEIKVVSGEELTINVNISRQSSYLIVLNSL
ncbi:MAG: glycosyl hydrolase [Candidatus Hodarchaeota archaeon]